MPVDVVILVLLAVFLMVPLQQAEKNLTGLEQLHA